MSFINILLLASCQVNNIFIPFRNVGMSECLKNDDIIKTNSISHFHAKNAECESLCRGGNARFQCENYICDKYLIVFH